ncbi:hypothetical protein ALON55S_08495 [Alishewanella longhuensis]
MIILLSVPGGGRYCLSQSAAMRGAKAAVIEAKAVGGTCVNGCAKKVMWLGARIAEAIKYGERVWL